MEKLLEILQKAIKMEKEYENLQTIVQKSKEMSRELEKLKDTNKNLSRDNRRLIVMLSNQFGIKFCDECGGEGGFETEEGGEPCPKCDGTGFIQLPKK